MLIHDGLTAQGLLQWLCFTPEESSFFNLERPTVTTQCNTDEGRPDIRIGIPAKVLIFLEVKKWSGLGREQLQRYRTVLSDANVPVTRLILLTVNPDEERSEERR